MLNDLLGFAGGHGGLVLGHLGQNRVSRTLLEVDLMWL